MFTFFFFFFFDVDVSTIDNEFLDLYTNIILVMYESLLFLEFSFCLTRLPIFSVIKYIYCFSTIVKLSQTSFIKQPCGRIIKKDVYGGKKTFYFFHLPPTPRSFLFYFL